MPSLHNVPPGDYEDLRIALVMNGGVSLAVWIGGVAHEINRAVRGKDRSGAALEYKALLDLTATTARVDVISGASAGGLNGALLALALVYDTDLEPLRGVWLTKGSLDRLLRSPYDKDPESLLLGNDRFLNDLRDAFDNLQRSGSPTPPAQVPIDLTLTATMLHGEPNRICDDLGIVISDVRHRAEMKFSRGEGFDKDPFIDKDIGARLALAARASASFPVAFEPIFCPVGSKNPPDDPRLVDMKGIASFGHSRFLVDGGVLDNKPIESALSAVFRQRPSGEVRRVLAYVDPAPGNTAVDRDDDPGKAPTLGQVALASLVSLPRVESISAHLQDIIEHNRQVRRKRQTRVVLVRELGAAGLRTLAAQLWAVYLERRTQSAADYIVEVLAAEIASGAETGVALGRRLSGWLSQLLSSRPNAPWVPRQLPDEDTGDARVDLAHWSWGLFTVEHIAEILIDLMRRALLVTPLNQSERRERLKAYYAAAYDLLIATPRTRRDDMRYWRSCAGALTNALAPGREDMVASTQRWADAAIAGSAARTVTLVPSERARRWATEPPPVGEVPVAPALGWVAGAMAGVLAAASEDVRAAATAGREHGRSIHDRQFATDLLAYVDYLAPADRQNAQAVLIRLLRLEVVQYATGSYRESPDQFVELVQVSANGRSPLGGPARAADKLAGAQLAGFGGFYKGAWRANDWLFGRMDGADRIVRILLNPARLARLYAMHAQAVEDALRAIAVPAQADPTVAAFLANHWRERAARVHDELAFLDRPDLPVPEQLPNAVEAVLAPIHLRMLREELPDMVAAARDDRRRGAGDRDAGAALVSAAEARIGNGGSAAWSALPPDQLVALFTGSGVGQERFPEEVGTDLFTSTLTQTLAVSATTVSGARAGLGVLGSALQVLRLPLLILHALAQTAARQSRTAAFIFGCALAVGATIVAITLFAPGAPISRPIIWFGSLLFVGAVLVSLRKSPRLAVIWLVVASLVWLLRSWLPTVVQDLWAKLMG